MMKTKKWILVLSVFGAFFRGCNAGAKGTVSYGMLINFFSHEISYSITIVPMKKKDYIHVYSWPHFQRLFERCGMGVNLIW